MVYSRVQDDDKDTRERSHKRDVIFVAEDGHIRPPHIRRRLVHSIIVNFDLCDVVIAKNQILIYERVKVEM